MNVLNCACAVLAITCFAAGCATTPPGTDQVRATTVLDDLPASTRAALSPLANFMNTPVERSPA